MTGLIINKFKIQKKKKKFEIRKNDRYAETLSVLGVPVRAREIERWLDNRLKVKIRNWDDS